MRNPSLNTCRRNPMLRRTTILLLLLTLLSAPLLAQEAQDTVVQNDGAQTVGEIIKETLKEVQLSLGQGVKTAVPRERIKEIVYDRKPSRYDDGVQKYNNGQHDLAVEAMEAVVKESDRGGRKIFNQHALFYLANSHAALGKYAEALQGVNRLLADFPDGLYFVDAWTLLARVNLAKGDTAAAMDVPKKAAAAAKNLGLPEDQLLAVDLIAGQALEAKGDFPAAIAAYKSVAGKAARVPRVQSLAKLGQGRCMVKAGQNPAEAESFFNDLAGKAEEPNILAGAYNGLGQCFLAKFEKNQDKDALHRALLSFMRGVVLYTPGRDDDGSEHAASLYGAGYCFEREREAKSGEQKDLWRTRAKQLYMQCVSRYAGHPAAAQAEERLKRLQ